MNTYFALRKELAAFMGIMSFKPYSKFIRKVTGVINSSWKKPSPIFKAHRVFSVHEATPAHKLMAHVAGSDRKFSEGPGLVHFITTPEK